MTLSCGKLAGNFTREIIVTTNDPQHPRENLICKGQILEGLTMQPKYLHFGRVAVGSTTRKTVQMTRGDGAPLAPKLSPIETPGFTAKVKEIEPGERYEIEVTFTPSAEESDVQANVVLQTGVPQVPTATIPLYAAVGPAPGAKTTDGAQAPPRGGQPVR